MPVDLASAPVTTGAPPGAVWPGTRRRLAAALPGTVLPTPLGTRDELTAVEPAAGGVPLLLTGHEALLAADGACPHCLARRWQAVRPAELREAVERGGGTTAAGEPALGTAFVADHLAAVLAACAGDVDDRDAGDGEAGPSVLQVDLDRLTVRRHGLLPDPECGCSPAPALGPPALEATPDLGDGRSRRLADLDLPMDALANPVCGAVGPVLVTDLTSVTTAATAGGFTTRSGSFLRQTLWGGHADTYAASGRIGLLEGLERYAGLRRRGTPALEASLDDLVDRDVEVLDPRRIGLYDGDFHAAHPEVDRFDPAVPIRWVAGHRLVRSTTGTSPVLVPEVLAHYQTPDQRRRFVQSTSSGCATGSGWTEAVLHALLEAVERDAFLIGWYAGLRLPEIDATTSTRPRTRQMVDRLALYGYEARFFDARIDLGIPVVTAVARRHDSGLGTLCTGAGASPDPEAALAAALCEIATDAPNLPHRTRADEARLRAMSEDFTLVQGLHDHPLAFGIPEMAAHADHLLARGDRLPLHGPAAYTSWRPSGDLLTDLRRCLDELAARDLDVVVVDQTLPEQRRRGLTTVCVLVPGLVPIDFGWDRQRALHLDRVRTAPRAAGRLDHDLTEADLHRIPHPFP